MADLVEIILRAKDEVSRAASTAGGSLGTLQQRVAGLASVATPVTAAVAAVGLAAVATARHAAALGDELADMSGRTGISVEQLSALKLAAQLSDTDLQSVANSTRFLNVAMVEAARGAGEQRDAFAALGISLADIARVSNDPVAALELVAKRLLEVENQSNRDAIAFRLLGRSAREQMLFLQELAEKGFKGIEVEARRLGLIISSDFARQASEFNDNVDRMRLTLDALAVHISGSVIKAFNDLAAEMGLVSETAERTAARGIESLIKRTESSIRAAQLRAKLPELIGGGQHAEADIAQMQQDIAQMEQARKALLDNQKALDDLSKPTQPTRTGALPDKDAGKAADEFKKAVDNLTDSLKKENDQLYAQILALREGEVAAAQFGMTARLSLLPKGQLTAEQTQAIDALINKYMGLQQQLREIQQEKARTDKILSEITTDPATSATLTGAEGTAGMQVFREQVKDMVRQAKDAQQQITVSSRSMSDVFLSDRQRERMAAQRWGEDLKFQIEQIADRYGKEFPQIVQQANALLAQLPAAIEHQELQRIAGGVRNILGGVTDAINTSIKAIIQGTQTAGQAFENLGQSILLSLGDRLLAATLDPLLDMLSQITAGAIKGIGSSVGQSIALSLFGAAKGGVLPGSFIPVKAFAAGGRVARPTFGFIGEAGPEAVVPLAGGNIPVAISWPELDALTEAISAAHPAPAPVMTLDALSGQIARAIQREIHQPSSFGLTPTTPPSAPVAIPVPEFTVVLNNPIDPRAFRMSPEEVVSIVAKDAQHDGVMRKVIMRHGRT